MKVHLRAGAAEFYQGLERIERERVDRIIRKLEEGHRPPKEQFKSLAPRGTGLWEVKFHQLRLLGGFVDGHLVLVHGLHKKQDDHRPADLDATSRLLETRGARFQPQDRNYIR